MAQFLTFLLIIVAIVWVVRRVAEQAKPARLGGKIKRKRLQAIKEAAQRIERRQRVPEPRASRPERGTHMTPPSRGARMDDPAGHWVDVLRVGEPESTEEAVRQLAAMGTQAYPGLRRALRDPAPFVRAQAQRAVEAIAAEQRRQATEPIQLPDPPASEAAPEAAPESAPEARTRPGPPPITPPPPPPDEVRETPPIPDAVPEPEPEREPEADTLEESVDVAAVLGEARGATSLGGERDEILARLAGGVLHFTIVVEDVERTSAFDAGPEFRGGSTVRAHLPASDVAVGVRVPPDHLEAAAPLERGREVVVAAAFRKWDNLYDRGVFEGRIVS